MSSNKPNIEGILLLEQPFIKVPYENLRKTFRTSQRHIEREFTALQNNSQDIVKKALRSDYGTDEAVAALDAMINRVEGLKRKLSELSINSTIPIHSILRKRLQSLDFLEDMTSVDSPEFDRWADVRLDRWLVDWALRTGNYRTARKIAETKGIEPFVDVELFSEIHRIEEALLAHSCSEALSWCSENKTVLRKMKSTLEFDLRLQEYIELARAQKDEEAISYSKKYLVPWYDTHGTQIRQASALLAYRPTTTVGTYKRLYDLGRWGVLSRTFRLAAYEISMLPTEPLLHLALYGGLSALRLPACNLPSSKPSSLSHNTSPIPSITSGPFYPFNSLSAQVENSSAVAPEIVSQTSTKQTRNVDCPTCDHECLGQLSSEVPCSHHVNSTIVCRISGKIIDQDNMPMALPNGQVYSHEALLEMAAKNNGKIICPQTGETYTLSSLKKVYIS